MPQVLYIHVDVSIDEYRKEFLVNPKGERFYCIPLDERSMVYEDAIITRNDDETLEIEGEQTLFNEHKGSGRSYEKMLSMYPAELIRKHSFLGIVWYSVNGTMTRRVRTRYGCRHKEYTFIERKEILSRSFKEG